MARVNPMPPDDADADSGTLVPPPPVSPVEAGSRAPGPRLGPDVLRRVRERDPRALAEFFETYFDRVYALVFRLLGDQTRAEDAVSEVFLKVHRAAGRLDAARDPMPWLVTIASNVCRDHWRSGAERMRRAALPVDDPALRESLTTGANEPERDLLAAEREVAVRAAIAELPDDLRESVLLYDYADLSHEDIAASLGITHDAARKRHSRALRALGKALRERLA
jgi:RNA polymerase sigma-70 factor (ECF subfamily)